MSENSRAAAISIASNTGLMVLKLTIGLLTGSVAVLSAAVDSLNDLVSSLIAFLTIREAEKPADPEHPFGHGKIDNISSGIQAVLIFAGAAYIIYEAVGRLLHPEPLRAPALALGVMAVTAVVDLIVARYLFAVAARTESPTIRATGLNLITDVLTAAAVFAGLLLVELTGIQQFDPITALLVAAVVLRTAFGVTYQAAVVLIDARLPDDELATIRQTIMSTPGVVGYHKLRTRRSGASRHIDYHLILPANTPLVKAHNAAERIEKRLRESLPNATVVTHIEPDTPDVTSEPDTTVRRRPGRRTRRSGRGSRSQPPPPA